MARLRGSPVGVMIAATVTFTMMAMRRYFESVVQWTTPIIERKEMTTGSSNTIPNPRSIPRTSESCSFMVSTGRSTLCTFNYADLPIPSSGLRAHETYTGSRSIANLNGKVVSCDVIQGTLGGPSGGQPSLEGHVIGCARPDGPCTADEAASLDGNGNDAPQRVTGGRFTMVRVSDSITCAQMPSVTFPPRQQ